MISADIYPDKTHYHSALTSATVYREASGIVCNRSIFLLGHVKAVRNNFTSRFCD
ncbi:MAG: hypothetical protein ABSD99_00080 [Candidatus Bathyarchaeia archaeon]